MKPNKQPDSRQQKANTKALASALSGLTNPDEVHAFLIDICTPAELQALADRWQVAVLLERGLSYRAINERTGVSVTTIGRVARFMSQGAGGYTAALGN
ncbi:MAG: YerC/YecD family TrpR-related protein [Pseudomonadota bacterium]